MPAKKSTPIHLLLVDDDVFNREGLRLYLTREGFAIHLAGDEAGAWQLASDVRPAVAVVDIGIPPDAATPSQPGQTSGLTLTRRLKREYPAMGVVLFSAHEDRGADVLQLIQSGHRGLGYKLKGSQPAALLAALREVLAGRVVIDPEVRMNRRTLADELRAALAESGEAVARAVLQRRHALALELEDVRAHRQALQHEAQRLSLLEQRVLAQMDLLAARQSLSTTRLTTAEAQAQLGEMLAGLSAEFDALQRATEQADAQTEHLHARAAAIEDLLSAGALTPNADADIEAQLATLKRQ